MNIESRPVLVVGSSDSAQAATEALHRRGLRGRVRNALADGERVGVLTAHLAEGAPRVLRVLPAERLALLSDGSAVAWETLILAPSPCASVDVQGELDAVSSVEEARAVLAIRRRPRRVAVLGDGLTAWEVAAAVQSRGPQTTLVAAELQRVRAQLGEATARLLERTHREHGVTLLDGRAAQRFDGRTLHLDDGTTLATTLVLDAREVKMCTEFLRDLSLPASGTVEVDDAMRSAWEGIYAVGDLARWRDPVTGRVHHLDHAAGHRRQAEIAVDAALGGTDRMDAVPFRRSRHFDLALTLLGVPQGDDREEHVGDLRRGSETVTWRGREGVTAVLTVTRDEAQRRSA